MDCVRSAARCFSRLVMPHPVHDQAMAVLGGYLRAPIAASAADTDSCTVSRAVHDYSSDRLQPLKFHRRSFSSALCARAVCRTAQHRKFRCRLVFSCGCLSLFAMPASPTVLPSRQTRRSAVVPVQSRCRSLVSAGSCANHKVLCRQPPQATSGGSARDATTEAGGVPDVSAGRSGKRCCRFMASSACRQPHAARRGAIRRGLSVGSLADYKNKRPDGGRSQ